MTGDYPSVTVAVCVRNGKATIATCLDSLISLDYPASKLKFLVIDNGSTDGTPEIISRFPVKVIHENKPGVAVARNAAWRNCETEFLAFTDADCTVTSGWIRELIGYLGDAKLGAIGGKIVTPGADIMARFYETRQIVSNEEFSKNCTFSRPFLATANIIFRMDALNRSGGFNEDLDVGEDADLCWRMQDIGYRVRYEPTGIVYHQHRTSMNGMFRQSILYGFGGVMVSFRHKEKYPALPWIWFGLYYRLIRSMLCLLFFWPGKNYERKMLYRLDFVRYLGIAIGRLKAAVRFRIPVL